MNRTNLTMALAAAAVLTAQMATESRAAKRPTADDIAMNEALSASVATDVTVPAKPTPRSGKRPAPAKPMSAWRAAYIAQHHHEPPVKAK